MRRSWIAQILQTTVSLVLLAVNVGASVPAPSVLPTDPASQPRTVAENTQAFLPLVARPGVHIPTGPLGWAMVAANPERTSWTPDEVRGPYNVDWYRPIEPYIPYKIQPIAANGAIYVSTEIGRA